MLFEPRHGPLLDEATTARVRELLDRVIHYGEQITLRVDTRLGIVFLVTPDGRSVRLTT